MMGFQLRLNFLAQLNLPKWQHINSLIYKLESHQTSYYASLLTRISPFLKKTTANRQGTKSKKAWRDSISCLLNSTHKDDPFWCSNPWYSANNASPLLFWQKCENLSTKFTSHVIQYHQRSQKSVRKNLKVLESFLKLSIDAWTL